MEIGSVEKEMHVGGEWAITQVQVQDSVPKVLEPPCTFATIRRWMAGISDPKVQEDGLQDYGLFVRRWTEGNHEIRSILGWG